MSVPQKNKRTPPEVSVNHASVWPPGAVADCHALFVNGYPRRGRTKNASYHTAIKSSLRINSTRHNGKGGAFNHCHAGWRHTCSVATDLKVKTIRDRMIRRSRPTCGVAQPSCGKELPFSAWFPIKRKESSQSYQREGGRASLRRKEIKKERSS